MHHRQIHLQGGIAQQAAQLRFRNDFRGHQVQQNDFQRADILPTGAVLGHDEYILLLQRLGCRQIVGNPDRHGIPSFSSVFVNILPERRPFVNSRSGIIMSQNVRKAAAAPRHGLCAVLTHAHPVTPPGGGNSNAAVFRFHGKDRGI